MLVTAEDAWKLDPGPPARFVRQFAGVPVWKRSEGILVQVPWRGPRFYLIHFPEYRHGH